MSTYFLEFWLGLRHLEICDMCLDLEAVQFHEVNLEIETLVCISWHDKK